MIPELFVAAATDVGQERERNEDSLRVATTSGGAKILVVCDGMGGHEAGELASRVAADTLVAALLDSAGAPIHEALAAALIRANDEVHDAAARLGVERMGTTAVVAWVQEADFWLGWAGDSRLYHLRDGEVIFRTVDHTRVQQMVDSGLLAPDEARRHPDAHMLTTVLGGAPADRVPFRPSVYEGSFALMPGDLLLLCSDGLTDEIEDHELAPLIAGLDHGDAASRLVEEANARGGHDNISVVVAVCGQTQLPQRAPVGHGRPTRKGLLASCLLPALLLLAASPAGAAKDTYCVSGYEGLPPRTLAACAQPEVAALHQCWHEHVYVSDGDRCYVCWDECDNSCIWNFLANSPGWKKADPYECHREGRVDDSRRIIAHVIDGIDAPAAAAAAAPPPPVDEGVRFDTSGLPDTCYVGHPCEGSLRLVRTAAGSQAEALDRLLRDPATEVIFQDTGEERSLGAPDPGDRYLLSRTFDEIGNGSWAIELRGSARTITMPAHQIRVRPPLRLRLPALLDFGTVQAGSELVQSCQRLDFSASQAAEEHRWRLQLEGVESCASEPLLTFRQGAGVQARSMLGGIEVEALDPLNRWLDICLLVPRCAADRSPPDARLRVEPLTPLFASQGRQIPLRWEVAGRSFIACHGWWLIWVLGVLGGVFVAVGILKPRRFPETASIRVAASERGLRRAPVLPLRECPGSRARFYRDARLGLHPDGSVNGKRRGALLLFRAGSMGVELVESAGVEIFDPRKSQWRPLDEPENGHTPSPRAIFRISGTYFMVDPG